MFSTRALSIRTPGRGQTMSFWNQVLKLWSPPEPIHAMVPSTAKNSNVSSNRAVETMKTVASQCQSIVREGHTGADPLASLVR